MKKLLILVFTLYLLLFTSCDTTGKVKLPDLNGMSREEMSAVLDEMGLNYRFQFSSKIIESDEDLNKFVSYVGNYWVGKYFPVEQTLIISTTVLPVNTELSSELKMDFEWEGKSFINDGVGKVKLVDNVDGDTAWFKDPYTGETFKARFLGVDTPETHAGEDPWGLAAARHTASRLNNAKDIVLESEGSRKDTYDRYLAFVWVDGVLLNLEIVELAYSNGILSGSKYSPLFIEANFKSMATGRRFFGEKDPEYDYENKRFY